MSWQENKRLAERDMEDMFITMSFGTRENMQAVLEQSFESYMAKFSIARRSLQQIYLRSSVVEIQLASQQTATTLVADKSYPAYYKFDPLDQPSPYYDGNPVKEQKKQLEKELVSWRTNRFTLWQMGARMSYTVEFLSRCDLEAILAIELRHRALELAKLENANLATKLDVFNIEDLKVARGPLNITVVDRPAVGPTITIKYRFNVISLGDHR
jgi:hypothetical protein